MVFLLFLGAGCGFQSSGTATGPGTGATSGSSGSNRKTPSSDRRHSERPTDRLTPEQLAAARKFEAAQRKEMEITSQLEQADKMLKGANLEGALRLVQRVEQENSQDPYVTMRTSYLQAMIFNRMKDGPRRKEAMNKLLKDMEALQGDPRFQQGFIDGQANQELIRMSLEKAGRKYGN